MSPQNENSLLTAKDLLRSFPKLNQLKLSDTVVFSLIPGIAQNVCANSFERVDFLQGRIYFNSEISVLENIGFGAPASVFYAELLIALGVQKIIVFGTAGALRASLNLGDVVCGVRSWIDEGTSRHYAHNKDFAQGNESLCLHVQKKVSVQNSVTAWTTDAPFRETRSKVEKALSVGCDVVEMESSAVFTLAEYHQVQACALFVISDRFTGDGWEGDFSLSRKKLIASLTTLCTNS